MQTNKFAPYLPGAERPSPVQIDLAEPPVAPGPPDLRIERVGMDRFRDVQALNARIFGDERVIQRLDRPHLTLLLAATDAGLVGFKVGYGESSTTFYSAKGGVLDGYRRGGVARVMLHRMMEEARALRYARFAYDTFPNKHPGMTVLGLAEGFTVTAAGYNPAYRDFRLRFEKGL
jgi:GNAT superfamily N-acetyltransferase